MKNIKQISMFSIIGLFLAGCAQENQAVVTPSIYTGNEVTYVLSSASAYNITGTATLKERTDKNTDIVIALSGNDGTDLKFPAHLHLGDISMDKTDVAALLSPVDNKTGKSTTTLKQLADETAITFTQLKVLKASIKIHLSDIGDGKNVILAAGNIGSINASGTTSGRISVGLCNSK